MFNGALFMTLLISAHQEILGPIEEAAAARVGLTDRYGPLRIGFEWCVGCDTNTAFVQQSRIAPNHDCIPTV